MDLFDRVKERRIVRLDSPFFCVWYGLVKAYHPKSVKHPMSSPFFGDIDPEVWHTCCMNPCQPIADFVCFFRHIYIFFWGGGGHKRYKNSGDKKRKKRKPHSSTAWQEHRACVRTIRTYLKKWRGQLGFCAENMCNLRNCLENT